MNAEEKSVFFLSWQSVISGPYSMGEIRNLLRLGRVNSLYKINVDGHWLMLRDHLTELERKASLPVLKVIAEPGVPAEKLERQPAYHKQTASHPPPPPPPPQVNIVLQQPGHGTSQGFFDPQGYPMRGQGYAPVQSSGHATASMSSGRIAKYMIGILMLILWPRNFFSVKVFRMDLEADFKRLFGVVFWC